MSTNNNIRDSEGGLTLQSKTCKQMSITFTGCGLLSLYYIGVIACLRKYLPNSKDSIVCGSSSGALAALNLCLDLPIESCTSKLVEVAIKAKNKSLGLLHPAINLSEILYEYLNEVLPEDCHTRASGRLFLSVTRVSDGKNVFINQFDSKEDLIKAMQCSCYIPLVSGIVPPKHRGISYIDGAFSDNFPKIDHHTVTVSPYGDSDICPKEDPYIAFNFMFYDNSIPLSTANLWRLFGIIFPGNPNQFCNLCDQGFNDTLRYLLSNDKISCTLCLSTQLSSDLNYNQNFESYNGYESTLRGEDVVENALPGGKDCEDCHNRRGLAEKDYLPDAVIQTIKKICSKDESNAKLWMNGKTPVVLKVVSLLSTLFLIPIDYTLAMCVKVWQQMPVIRNEHRIAFQSLVIFARSFATFGKFKYQ